MDNHFQINRAKRYGIVLQFPFLKPGKKSHHANDSAVTRVKTVERKAHQNYAQKEQRNLNYQRFTVYMEGY